MPQDTSRFSRKKPACLQFRVDQVPVIMAVAEASDIKMPAMHEVHVDGINCHVQSHQAVNMVMVVRSG